MQSSARISSARKFSNFGKLVFAIYVCFGILYIAASPPDAILIKQHAKLLNNHEQKTNNERTRTSILLSDTNLSNVVQQNSLASIKQSLTNISNGLITLFGNNRVHKERIFEHPNGYFSNHENHDTKTTQNSVFGHVSDVQNGYNIKGLNNNHEPFLYPIFQAKHARKKSKLIRNYKSRKRENVEIPQFVASTHAPHSNFMSTHPEFPTTPSPPKQHRDER